MARIEDGTGAEYARIETVKAAPIGEDLVKQITATVGTSVYTISPPAGTWQYLQVINNHATAVLTVAINENPAAAPAATPGVAGDWEAGYPIPPMGSAMLPIAGTLTTIRLLSDTASTPVILGLVA